MAKLNYKKMLGDLLYANTRELQDIDDRLEKLIDAAGTLGLVKLASELREANERVGYLYRVAADLSITVAEGK